MKLSLYYFKVQKHVLVVVIAMELEELALLWRDMAPLELVVIILIILDHTTKNLE